MISQITCSLKQGCYVELELLATFPQHRRVYRPGGGQKTLSLSLHPLSQKTATASAGQIRVFGLWPDASTRHFMDWLESARRRMNGTCSRQRARSVRSSVLRGSYRTFSYSVREAKSSRPCRRKDLQNTLRRAHAGSEGGLSFSLVRSCMHADRKATGPRRSRGTH